MSAVLLNSYLLEFKLHYAN